MTTRDVRRIVEKIVALKNFPGSDELITSSFKDDVRSMCEGIVLTNGSEDALVTVVVSGIYTVLCPSDGSLNSESEELFSKLKAKLLSADPNFVEYF